MNKHTPGPCQGEGRSMSKPVGSVIGWYGGHPMIELFPSEWIPAVGTVLYSAPDNLAAAAPDLLEALNAMLEYTASLNAIQGFEEYDHAAVKQACAAIAKAKGGI